jgi:YihY family inner membrane protein
LAEKPSIDPKKRNDLVVQILRNLYTKANLASGKRLDIIRHTFQSFSRARAAQAAASMAYYAFFSLFPLMLIFVALGSFFLQSNLIYSKIITMLGDAFPVSNQLIEDTLSKVIASRGPMGLIGLVGLFWSASGVFTTLTLNINLAWAQARRRNFLQERLVGLGMIAILVLVFILSLFMDTTTQVLASFRLPLPSSISIYENRLWAWVSTLLPWLFIFTLFILLYRWAPTVRPAWRAVFWSAALAATGWKLATTIFTRYIIKGLINYELVYGSLGTVAALLFLIYSIGIIVLFGAHVCAAIDFWVKSRALEKDIYKKR